MRTEAVGWAGEDHPLHCSQRPSCCALWCLMPPLLPLQLQLDADDDDHAPRHVASPCAGCIAHMDWRPPRQLVELRAHAEERRRGQE